MALAISRYARRRRSTQRDAAFLDELAPAVGQGRAKWLKVLAFENRSGVNAAREFRECATIVAGVELASEPDIPSFGGPEPACPAK